MKVKKFISFIMLTAAVLFFVQCSGVQIPKGKQNYVGVWESPKGSPTYMYLVISSNGQVKYRRVDPSTSTSLTAPISEWKGKNFKVGALGVATEFVVQKAPYRSGGRWYMTVDGVKLVKLQ